MKLTAANTAIVLDSTADFPEAPKRFEKFDANKDGILSRDEFIHMGAKPKR